MTVFSILGRFLGYVTPNCSMLAWCIEIKWGGGWGKCALVTLGCMALGSNLKTCSGTTPNKTAYGICITSLVEMEDGARVWFLLLVLVLLPGVRWRMGTLQTYQ